MGHDLIDQLLNEKQVAIWLGISLPSLQRVGELMSTEQAPRTLRVNGGPCRECE